MDYVGYLGEIDEENVVITLDGNSSLGVSLRSRFGGKGCYVDNYLEENGEAIGSVSIHIGDTLLSINGDDVKQLSIESIYRKVQSLTFPIRLHFQRFSPPSKDMIFQDIFSMNILCYYSWIKRYIKSSPRGNGQDYHSDLALWSRIFQVTLWLNTLFLDEDFGDIHHNSNDCTQFASASLSVSQLQRISHTLLLQLPTDENSNTVHDTSTSSADVQNRYFNFIRTTLQAFLQAPAITVFLQDLVHSFANSTDIARMVAFNPGYRRWQYVPLSDLCASSEGVLLLNTVLSVTTSSNQLKRLCNLAYYYHRFHSNHAVNHIADQNCEVDGNNIVEANENFSFIVQEVLITLIEEGLFRRIYESDGYFVLLQVHFTGHQRLLRELFPLLPRCFSMHHYTKQCCGPDNCGNRNDNSTTGQISSTVDMIDDDSRTYSVRKNKQDIITLEIDVSFDILQQCKVFNITQTILSNFNNADHADHDVLARLSKWAALLGVDEPSLINTLHDSKNNVYRFSHNQHSSNILNHIRTASNTSSRLRHLAPQLEQVLLSLLRRKSMLLPNRGSNSCIRSFASTILHDIVNFSSNKLHKDNRNTNHSESTVPQNLYVASCFTTTTTSSSLVNGTNPSSCKFDYVPESANIFNSNNTTDAINYTVNSNNSKRVSLEEIVDSLCLVSSSSTRNTDEENAENVHTTDDSTDHNPSSMVASALSSLWLQPMRYALFNNHHTNNNINNNTMTHRFDNTNHSNAGSHHDSMDNNGSYGNGNESGISTDYKVADYTASTTTATAAMTMMRKSAGYFSSFTHNISMLPLSNANATIINDDDTTAGDASTNNSESEHAVKDETATKVRSSAEDIVDNRDTENHNLRDNHKCDSGNSSSSSVGLLSLSQVATQWFGRLRSHSSSVVTSSHNHNKNTTIAPIADTYTSDAIVLTSAHDTNTTTTTAAADDDHHTDHNHHSQYNSYLSIHTEEASLSFSTAAIEDSSSDIHGTADVVVVGETVSAENGDLMISNTNAACVGMEEENAIHSSHVHYQQEVPLNIQEQEQKLVDSETALVVSTAVVSIITADTANTADSIDDNDRSNYYHLGTVRAMVTDTPSFWSLRHKLYEYCNNNKNNDKKKNNNDNNSDTNKKKNNNTDIYNDDWCFDILCEQIAPGLLFLLFHARLLEISVLLLSPPPPSSSSTTSGSSIYTDNIYSDRKEEEEEVEEVEECDGSSVAVLVTQWLQHTLRSSGLPWPHTHAVHLATDVSLSLLPCPTPVWLAVSRHIYLRHLSSSNSSSSDDHHANTASSLQDSNAASSSSTKNGNIHSSHVKKNGANFQQSCGTKADAESTTMVQENILVVDLLHQTVYWPKSLYRLVAQGAAGNHDNENNNSNNNIADTTNAEIVALFQLVQKLPGTSQDVVDAAESIVSRFVFSPHLLVPPRRRQNKEKMTAAAVPLFYRQWLRCYFPLSFSLLEEPSNSTHGSHHPSVFGQNRSTADCHRKNMIPLSLLTIPSAHHTSSLFNPYEHTTKDDSTANHSQKFNALQSLCQTFVHQVLFGLKECLLDISLHTNNNANNTNNGNDKSNNNNEACLCLDEDYFLWLKKQQILHHHHHQHKNSNYYNSINDDNNNTRSRRVLLLFGEPEYRPFLRAWLRSQALSVYITTDLSSSSTKK